MTPQPEKTRTQRAKFQFEFALLMGHVGRDAEAKKAYTKGLDLLDGPAYEDHNFDDGPSKPAREYKDAHNNQLGVATFEAERDEYVFHCSWPNECPWAEGLSSPSLSFFDHIAAAIEAHLDATGH